jgi:MFS family permease
MADFVVILDASIVNIALPSIGQGLHITLTSILREGAQRNRALSLWGAVAGSGAAAGVLLGGVLTSGLGWRSVLFVNLPIGIAAILLTPRLVAESRGDTARGALTCRARRP